MELAQGQVALERHQGQAPRTQQGFQIDPRGVGALRRDVDRKAEMQAFDQFESQAWDLLTAQAARAKVKNKQTEAIKLWRIAQPQF